MFEQMHVAMSSVCVVSFVIITKTYLRKFKASVCALKIRLGDKNY